MSDSSSETVVADPVQEPTAETTKVQPPATIRPVQKAAIPTDVLKPQVVAPVCRACGYGLLNVDALGGSGRGVSYSQCERCKSLSARSPNPVRLGDPRKYLTSKSDFDRLAEPVLVWYQEDGSFIKLLTNEGYEATGYDPRLDKDQPKGTFATVLVVDGLEYEQDVSSAIAKASAYLRKAVPATGTTDAVTAGVLVIQQPTFGGFNPEEVVKFNLAHPELGSAVILTQEGLVLAAKRAGLNVINQDFAHAIIFGY